FVRLDGLSNLRTSHSLAFPPPAAISLFPSGENERESIESLCAASRPTSFQVFVSQTRTSPDKSPDASSFPSGANASARTEERCPARLATRFPVLQSHTKSWETSKAGCLVATLPT